ncbi:hypothetical protein MP228_004710 [Amoeboaphelidium protococcarum]|nr:hypothetical protein MP228_004710 [Amoeboaphelidium protococcarum]
MFDTTQNSLVYKVFIRFLQAVSSLACGFLVGTNIYMMVQIAPGIKSSDSAMDFILRIYNVIFALLIILSYFDIKAIASQMYFLITFFGSGMLHVFVGILTIGASTSYVLLTQQSGNYSDYVDKARLYSGWALVAIGLLQTVMSILQFPPLTKEREMLRLSKSSLARSQQKGIDQV